MSHSPSGLENIRSPIQPPSTLRTSSQPAPLDRRWPSGSTPNSSNGTGNKDSRGQNTLRTHLIPPKLIRAFSQPQLGHLRHPHATIDAVQQSILSSTLSPGADELATELADSVQMIIQTLLQTSPPHILDPTREQLSGCALQIPTPSISALFTSMKTLSYMSKHIHAFNIPLGPSTPAPAEDDFDVGDLLQSVGDALSGLAAQTGVDLVIFHGDPTLRNLAVRTDECALIYALSYIVRQILVTSSRGDVLELGVRVVAPERQMDGADMPSSSMAPIRYVFEFKHKVPRRYAERDGNRGNGSQPNLWTATLHTLLEVLRAELSDNLAPSTSLWRGKYELTVLVVEGKATDPNVSSEDAAKKMSISDVQLAREPTIAELSLFVNNLRGHKATFYSNSRSAFAQYLTSYLTAWGMDVFHHASDSGNGASPDEENVHSEGEVSGDSTLQPGDPSEPSERPSVPMGSSETTTGSSSFVIIDDEINVLRSKLTESQVPLLHSSPDNRVNKRPSLAHRPKSSSLIRRAMLPSSMENGKSTDPSVIVHFTSLSNYRAVKDVVQASLISNPARLPEVIVIPKPAGLRRFITALYTAINRPLVDPLYFSPIATSPMSPGVPLGSPFFSPPSSSPTPAQSSLPSSEAALETVLTPSTSGTPTPTQVFPTSPLGTESLGYFRKEGSKFAGSASSGLFVKGPDGKTGILFQLSPTQRDDTAGGSEQRPSRADTSDLTPRHHPTLKDQNTIDTSNSEKAILPSESTSHSADQVLSPASQLGMGDMNAMGSAANPVFEKTPIPLNPPKPIKASIVGAKAKKKDRVVLPITVLIVEDNPIQRNILATFMKTKQIDYGIAENGLEAVEKWRTGNYHLVLMDIQMPVMDGIEATKQIRQLESAQHRALSVLTPLSEGSQTPNSTTSADSHQPATPFHSSVIIVALTAQTSQADRVVALAAGCNDFLTKPVRLPWLEKKIIEWGSIKVLQMWADPEVEPALRKRQQASARAVADNLRIVRPASKAKQIETTTETI